MFHTPAMEIPYDAFKDEVPLRLAEPVTGLQSPECGTVVGQGGDACRRDPNDIRADLVMLRGAKSRRRNLVGTSQFLSVIYQSLQLVQPTETSMQTRTTFPYVGDGTSVLPYDVPFALTLIVAPM